MMTRLAIASTRWKMLIQIFCVGVILNGVLAGPAGLRRTSKCVSFCKESSKFTYEPGTSYYYDYSNDIATSSIGGSNLESRIHLKTKVEIAAVTKCELLLRLQNVVIEESLSDDISVRQRVQGSQALANELERLPLRFSFQDGKVEHLCAAEDESTWTLNVKRGILSALQNTMDNLEQDQTTHESDVSGRCQTAYKALGNSWAGSMAFEKVKDLGECSHRHSHISAVQSIPYTSQSMMQNLPLLKSKQECTQNILNGRIERVQCQETHKFQPFQQEESGAQTTVSQMLVFDTEVQGFIPSDESLRTWKASLFYQSDGPVDASEEDIVNIMSLLQKLETDSVPEIKAEAPEQFINLVDGLRLINLKAMQDLFTRVNSPIAKKFLLDAMPLVASAPSLALMRDLLLDGRLTEKQIDAWVSSMIFIKNPTVEMLAALKPLVYQPRDQALLGVSAMVNSYCKNNPECTEEAPVEEILEKLFSYVGSSCKTPEPEGTEQVNGILFALKAIGNAGRLPADDNQRSMDILARCFSDRSNPTEIRLAALDAFRRMPCDTYDHEPILNTYSTINENTEVRIKAYLTAMKCADRRTVDVIKDYLYTDAVNQVTSFVWTHLTNLQETASPDKQAIKDLLSNEFLKNKFTTDARKYSRNYEGSFFSEKWNAGANTDSNIIFTPDSFLPRSAMFNLTVHLLGESINLLEVGVRVKRLEHLLEPIFGPNGYFPDQKVNDALHSMRPKRDVSDNRIERLSHVYSQAALDEHTPTGSVYTRIFGHEILYKNFEIGTEGNRPSLVDESGKDWMDLRSILNTITRGNSVEYRRSNVILDASYTIPTAAGIPLSLSIQSASTVGVTANGTFDVEKLWDKKELEIKGLLRPSAAIQVDGVMSAQLGRASNPIRSGLRLQNTLHTSTAIQGEITAKGHKIIKSSLSLPQDKQEIFTAKSQLLILRPSGRPHVIEQGPAGLPKTEYSVCKGNRIIGLEICTEVNMPHQFSIPLSTPALISVYARKIDTINSYDFNYEFNTDGPGTSLILTFDTPGGQINRRLEGNFQLDPSSGILDASIKTPLQSFNVEGRYSNRQKNIQLTISHSEQEMLLLNAGLFSEASRLTPALLVKLYDRPLLEFQGTVDLLNITEDNGRATADLVLKHLTQTPIQVRADISRNGDKFDSRIGVESPVLTGNIRSQLRLKPGYFSTKAVAEYSWQQAATKTVDINFKFQRSKKGVLSKFNAMVNLVIPDSPDYKIDATVDAQRSPGYCESNVKLTLGRSSWEGKTLYNNQKSRDSQKFAITAALKSPLNRVDYNAEFAHLWNQTAMLISLAGHTSPDNAISGQIEYLDGSEDLLRRSLTAMAAWPESDYSLRSTLKETSPNDYEAELIVSPNNDAEMKATVSYKDGSNDLKLDHSVVFRARGFTRAPFSGDLAFSASDRQAHLGLQVKVDGDEDYSGWWSTSLDYHVVKKNTHKLEGKLTLNDKKYNGEMSFRQAKNGDRIFTLDAQGNRHLGVEATLGGDLMGPLSLSVTVYPDKLSDPMGKFAMAMILNWSSVSVRVDNFGMKIQGLVQYDDSTLLLECNYSNQLYRLQANFPNLSINNANVSLRVQTPLENYREILITLAHQINDGSMDSKISTTADAFELSATVLGTSANGQIATLLSLEMTGIENLKGELQLTNQPLSKKFYVTASRGLDDSSVQVEFTRIQDGFSFLLDFSVLSSLPQLHIEASNQINEQLNSNLKIEWTMPKSSSQQVSAQLSGVTYPLQAKLSLRSPWRKFELMEGEISFKNQRHERELIASLNGQFHCMPISLTVRCKGNRADFRHEIIQTWTSRGSPTTIQFTSEGHYSSISDTVIKTSLTLPQDVYEFNWASEKNDEGQKYEMDVAKNRMHYLSGATWKYDQSQKHFRGSVWCEPHNKPRFAVTVENIKRPDQFLLQFITNRGIRNLVSVNTNLRIPRDGQWDFTSDIDSIYDSIPKLKVTSKNELEGGNVQHKSQLTFGGKASRDGRRGIYEIPQTATAEFNLQAGGRFDGLLSFNDENIMINGDVKKSSGKHEIQAEITSTRFSSISAEAQYHRLPNGHEISLSTSANGNSLITLKAATESTHETLSANLDVDCSFGHHFIGTTTIDKTHNEFDFSIKEDRSDLIDLQLHGKAQEAEGNLSFEIRSSIVSGLEDKLKLHAEYELGDEYKFNLKYAHGQQEHAVEGSGAWNNQNKFLRLGLRGQHNADFKAEIQGMGTSECSLVWNDDLIFNTAAVVNHRKENGIHLHDVTITTNSIHLSNPFEVTITIGYGQNKVQLLTVTPVRGWTRISVSGEWNRHGSERGAKLTIEKEQSTYLIKGTCIQTSRGRKVSFEAMTPWKSYSSAKIDIEYERKHGFEGKVHASLNDQRIGAQLKFTPSSLSVEVETPFAKLQQGSVSVSWNLSAASKNVVIKLNHNSEVYELQGSWTTDSVSGQMKLVFLGQGITRNLDVNYDTSENYNVYATLTSDGLTQNKIGGRVTLNKQGIEIEGFTPLTGYEQFRGKAGYEKKGGRHYAGNAEWELNGDGDRFQAEIKYTADKIELDASTSLFGLDNLKLEITHRFGGPKKELSIQGQVNEARPFKFSLEGRADEKVLQFSHSSATASVELKVDFPMQVPLKLDFSAEYRRRNGAHTLKSSMTHNGETTTGNIVLSLPRSRGFTADVQLSAVVPAFSIDNFDATCQLSIGHGTNSFSAEYTLNEEKHMMQATFQATTNSLQLTVDTTFRSFRTLRANASASTDDGTFQIILAVNDKQGSLEGRYSFNGVRHTKLQIDLMTPFEGLKSMQGSAEIKFHPGLISTSMTFQNDRFRYVSQLDATYNPEFNKSYIPPSASIQLVLKSPVYRFEHLISSFNYSLEEIPKMEFTYERNTKREITAEVSLANGELNLSLESVAADFPVKASGSLQTKEFVLGALVEAGYGTDAIKFGANIDGFTTGNVDVETPFQDYERIAVQWSIEGDISMGKAQGKFSIPKVGEKSFKSTWRTENWQSAKLEAFFKSSENDQEKRYAIQYSVSGREDGNGKVGASIVYTVGGQEQQMTLTTSVKRHNQAITIDGTIQTPYHMIEEAAVHGKLTLGQETSLDLSASLNQRVQLVSNIIVSVSPKASKLKLTFNAPALGEPFSVNAAYDVTKPEKLMEVAFLQNKYQISVRTDAKVPHDSNEIELHMSVDSNVPLLQISASGSMKAGYLIDADSTRRLSVSVNSETTGKWDVSIALRPTSDFYALLQIDSPRPDIIQSFKTEIVYTGNRRQGISSYASFQLGESPELKISFSFSMEKIVAAFVSGIPGYEDISFEAKFETSAGYVHKRFHIQANAMGESIKLKGFLHIPSGTSFVSSGQIELHSSWDKIPNASLVLEVNEDGTGKIEGAWGSQSVTIEATLRGAGRVSWRTQGTTDITVKLNSEDLVQLSSVHFVGKNSYSVNITVGENYQLNTFLQTSAEKIISTKVMWGDSQFVELVGKAGLGRFEISAITPWTKPIEANGMYTVTDREYSAKGFFTFGGERSALEANAITAPELFDSSISIDIPALHQKFDTRIKIRKTEGNKLRGNIDVEMTDRRLSIEGELSSRDFSKSGRRYVEKNVKVYMTLPSTSYPKISTDVTIQLPTSDFSSVKVDASLSLPSGTSKGTFGYEVPIHRGQGVGIHVKLDNPYVSEHPIEFLISKETTGSSKFEMRFQYEQNDLHISYDTTLSKLHMAIFANVPELFGNHSPIRLELTGVGKLPQEQSLKISGACSQYTFSIEGIVESREDTTARFIANIPALFDDQYELSAKIQRNSSEHYLVDITGLQGTKSIELRGETNWSGDSLSTSARITGALGNHFAQFKGYRMGDNFIMEVNGESAILLTGRRFKAEGKFKPISTGFEAEILCRTRMSTHSAKITSVLALRNGNIRLTVLSPSLTPITAYTEWAIAPEIISAKLDIDAGDESHQAQILANFEELEAMISLQCPTLLNDELSVHGKAVVNTNAIEFLGEAKMNGAQWKLEGMTRYEHTRDMEVKLELRTPFEDWDRFTFAGKSSSEDVLAEIYTPFPNFPSALIRVSGFPVMSLYDSPDLKLLDETRPRIVIGLPWITYIISGVLKAPQKGAPGEFSVNVDMHKQHSKTALNKRYEASIMIPSLEDFSWRMENPVKIRMSLQIPHSTSVHWEVGGRLQWKTWAELNAVAELNGQRFEFDSEIRNEQGNRRLSVTFSTPFEGYEKYAASMRLENYQEIGRGRTILVELQKPQWESPIRMEIDYRYRFNGFADMDAEINIACPRFVIDFPPMSIRAQSTMRGGRYSGGIEGRWKDMRPFLRIEAGMSESNIFGSAEGSVCTHQVKGTINLGKQGDSISLSTEGQYGNEQVFLMEAAMTQSDSSMNAQVSLVSPFQLLRSASIILRLSPLSKETVTLQKILDSLDIAFEVNHNDKKIFQIELVSKGGRRSVEVFNPFRPVSVALTFERVAGQELRVLTEICWNLESPSQSTLALEFGITKTSASYTFITRAQAGELGGVKVSVSHLLTSTRLEQAVSVRIINPMKPELAQEVGYSVSLNDISTGNSANYFLTARIDTPWRSIGVEGSEQKGEKEIERKVELKWDALRDVTKRVGVKIYNERSSAWKSRVVKDTITLVHSTLPDNFVLAVERSYKSHQLHSIELVLKPSRYAQDFITIAGSKENMGPGGLQVVVSHPSSNLNVKVIARRTYSTAAVGVTYMDVNGESQEAEVSFASDGSSTIFEINAGKGLVSVLKFEIARNVNKNSYHFRSGDVKMDLNVVQSLPEVDFTLQYDSNKQLYISAGLPHNKEISFRVWRNEYGMIIQDVQAILRLNASQVLSSKLKWRPELYDDIETLLKESAPKMAMRSASKGYSMMQSSIGEELQGRWSMVEPSTREFLENFAAYTYAECRTIYMEFKATLNYFAELYDRNKFYMKDVGNIIDFMINSCISAVQSSVEAVEIFGMAAYDGVLGALKWLEQYVGKLEKIIMTLWGNADEYLLQIWEENVTTMSEMIESVEEYYDMLVASIDDKIEELQRKILAIGWVRKLVRLYQEYASWVEELPVPIQEVVEAMAEFINENVCKPVGEYLKPHYNQIRSILENKDIQAILETPPLPYLRHAVLKIKGLGVRFWDFIEAEQRIKEVVAQALHAIDNLIARNMPSTSLTWEVDKGHIEFHHPMTLVKWDDFTSLPTWRGDEDDAHQISQINNFYYELLDTIRNVKPALEMNLRDILPPFGSHAVMAGDHHYYTFDKKYFRFAGECSYVLVADLLHQNFSLLVNYESSSKADGRKMSYTLVTQRHSVDIDVTSMKVTLDGRKTELPLEVGPTFIRRMPNGIEIFDTRGFQMTCNQSPALCTVSVSGWYFGKIAGLLGTYDNEESNDLRTPDGEIVTDVANFAHSWRVGDTSGSACRMKNMAGQEEEPMDVDGVCGQHFDDATSLLRPCFTRVNTTIFKEMCLYDTSKDLNKASRQESACTAISAYVAECQKEGVDIWLPPPCIRCTLEDSTKLMSGEFAVIKSDGPNKPPNSTDVVVLLEEASCLSGSPFTEAIKRLDSALRAKGMHDNRYALVGFGGQGPHGSPHIRTTAGQIWAHNTLFRVGENIEMNGEGNGDLYDAIEFASRTLKFRAGAAKTMIAMTCGSEQCGSESRYPDAITLLLENDIKLHLLTTKEFTAKGNKRDGVVLSSKVYGMDSEGFYTLNHARDTNLPPDNTMKRLINLPKDLCTPLAIESNGTRFVIPKTPRKSLEVWSRRVAKTAEPSSCLQCECIPDKSGSPHVVCQQCISPSLQQMLMEWQQYKTFDEAFPIELMEAEQS